LLDGAVLGHASEMKNSVMLPEAKAPHFAYLGDSILGSRVNLGAGTKLSNLSITALRHQKTLTVQIDGLAYDTGLTKLGAILGDDVQTGCNVVLNPGTLLGRGARVYPNTSVRGYHGPGEILKLRQHVETAKWR
jgi:bifunctional N-acetylglucosamine-1-phosphate-uridyltransferase/glucosamine-1-phosphate-acetyltransferase GlmU-like protein